MVHFPIGDEGSQSPPQTRTPRRSHGVMPNWLGMALVVVFGANFLAGIIYWAVHGWLVGVGLSALLPGFGLVSIVVSVLF